MSASPSHILVIDDNEAILRMLKTMFEMNGYQVTTMQNINELESALSAITPDLLLMDMLLSGADGRDVCKTLKKNNKFSHIPLIMISAHPNARQECLEAGANYFIEKPFDINDLIATVRTALT